MASEALPEETGSTDRPHLRSTTPALDPTALALGSWLAVVPHIVVIALFVRRAALEDRVLREELEGYAAYAATVRYRFLPGIW